MATMLGSHRLTRRAFLGVAAASAGALAAASPGGLGLMEALAATTTRYPLYVPSVVNAGSTPYTLTEAPGKVDLGGGRMSNAWVYNGLLPGPTFRVAKGVSASFTLKNGLPEETITHWHGMVVDHDNDGHPMEAIPPGGTYSYSFPVNQRAALNWYHPHPHMLTGKQVALGLAGGFIVTDAEEAALGLPSGTHALQAQEWWL